MPSRSIIRTGIGPHREPRNRFPAMAAINLLAARAARVQSRRNLSRSLSPKLDHSHSITRFDRSRTGPKPPGDAPGLALRADRSLRVYVPIRKCRSSPSRVAAHCGCRAMALTVLDLVVGQAGSVILVVRVGPTGDCGVRGTGELIEFLSLVGMFQR